MGFEVGFGFSLELEVGFGVGGLAAAAEEEEEGFLSEGLWSDSQRDLRKEEDDEGEGLWDEADLGWVPPAIVWISVGMWGSYELGF